MLDWEPPGDWDWGPFEELGLWQPDSTATLKAASAIVSKRRVELMCVMRISPLKGASPSSPESG